MKTKAKELCGATFDDAVCTKKKQHFGKHLDERGGHGWVAWTDAGAARVLAERAAEAVKTPVIDCGQF